MVRGTTVWSIPIINIAFGIYIPAIDSGDDSVENVFTIRFFDFPAFCTIRCDMRQDAGSIVTYLKRIELNQSNFNGL